MSAVLFLQVGDEVWVKKCITEPAGGWAGVTHNSVGTLLSVNGEDVVVNFTECKEWRGLLTELEKVRPISIGDKVRVSFSNIYFVHTRPSAGTHWIVKPF